MRVGDEVDGFRTADDDHPGDGQRAVCAARVAEGDRHDYCGVVPLLAGQRRVVVPDLRGFGETQGPPGAEPAELAAGGQTSTLAA